jgi:hypothetical protein
VASHTERLLSASDACVCNDDVANCQSSQPHNECLHSPGVKEELAVVAGFELLAFALNVFLLKENPCACGRGLSCYSSGRRSISLDESWRELSFGTGTLLSRLRVLLSFLLGPSMRRPIHVKSFLLSP